MKVGGFVMNRHFSPSCAVHFAANLALVQLARGRDTRGEMREGLLAVRSYPGVSGVLSMGADGNAHKRPFLMGVERGKIVELDL